MQTNKHATCKLTIWIIFTHSKGQILTFNVLKKQCFS
uniref:Uncharacterized protein n=1 Tax=Rhizophora mucronata TaxID=61149 RepID=A0A2P2PSV2_RHIMU